METYLSLGSNIGDREENLKRAVFQIKNFFDISDISPIYLTSPVGFKEQPDFLNLVLKININKSNETIVPEKLLKKLKDIEIQLGRKKTFKWGPRLIDIDILLMGNLVYKSRTLEIPHKELFKRNFVLIPLSDILESIKIGNKSYKIKKLIDKNDLIENPVSLYKKREKIINWIADEQ